MGCVYKSKYSYFVTQKARDDRWMKVTLKGKSNDDKARGGCKRLVLDKKRWDLEGKFGELLASRK